jgi:hypothetical protein
MLLVVVGMALGVIFSNKPLKGSCGGVGKALQEEDYVCDLCGNDENKCDEINAQEGGEEAARARLAAQNSAAEDSAVESLAVDATKKS